MTEATTTDAAPAPMEGHGAYNRASRVQAAGLAVAIPLFERAATEAALAPALEPIVIADYGASEGHNSMLPVGAAAAALRARVGRERALLVMHTDLPDNDFSALFEALANDPDSYQRGDPNIYAAAVGRSFYEQLLPKACVTLGWCSWSVHWLSRTPCVIPDQLQVAYSRDAAAIAAYARQAAEDWLAFLAARGAELRAGGRLVVLTMAKTDSGDFGYALVLAALNGALADLVADGALKAEEVRNMSIPTVGRTPAEFAAPFAGGDFAGLRIEALDGFLGEDHIFADYQRDGDAAAFGRRWASFVRASTFPTLALSLEPPGDAAREARLFDALEGRLAARLTAAPGPNVMQFVKMLLAKGG